VSHLAAPTGLRDLAHEAGAAAIRGVDTAAMPQLMRQLDEVALLAMRVTLHEAGAFRDGVARTADDVCDLVGVAARHRWVLRRWLTVLTDEGLLDNDTDTGRFSGPLPADRTELAAAARALNAARRGLGYPPAMTRFFLTAIEYLPQLLRDEIPLQALLFPDGDLTTAEAAYKDNIINLYLNAATARVLHHISVRHQGPQPLHVLELGAGVGGTTTDVLDVLAERPTRYLFTDLSRFFLDTARERFAGYPFLSYALFDINGDLSTQHVAPGSQHVVLAANVAHNAYHVDTFLTGLRDLLTPGGTLLLIESCREHYQVMTSMQFLMSARAGGQQPGRDDVRAGTDHIFLTRAQWLSALDRAGFTPALNLPDPAHPLAALAQHVFVAHA
jgi:mycobactin polyketide synthetase MbtD/pyochelin synthetase